MVKTRGEPATIAYCFRSVPLSSTIRWEFNDDKVESTPETTVWSAPNAWTPLQGRCIVADEECLRFVVLFRNFYL
jgi:hypothetical protein